VGHAQWVFTIPKMLRPVFFRRRELRGVLARLAWHTVQKLMAAAACELELRPGMVSVIQTFGDRGVRTPGRLTAARTLQRVSLDGDGADAAADPACQG